MDGAHGFPHVGPEEKSQNPLGSALLPRLAIRVKSASDLSTSNVDAYVLCGPSDSLKKAYQVDFLTKKVFKLKSEVVKKTKAPVWKNFGVSIIAHGKDKPVRFEVFDHATIGSDKFLGEALFEWDKYDLKPGVAKTITLSLVDSDEPRFKKGAPTGKLELEVTLSFKTTAITGQKYNFRGSRVVRPCEDDCPPAALAFKGVVHFSFEGEFAVVNNWPTLRVKNFVAKHVSGFAPSWVGSVACSDFVAAWAHDDTWDPALKGELFVLNGGKRATVIPLYLQLGADLDFGPNGNEIHNYTLRVLAKESQVIPEHPHNPPEGDFSMDPLEAKWYWVVEAPGTPVKNVFRFKPMFSTGETSIPELPFSATLTGKDVQAHLQKSVKPGDYTVNESNALADMKPHFTLVEMGYMPGDQVCFQG